jgi:RNA polymerase sigma factor (TIGR02999 family)
MPEGLMSSPGEITRLLAEISTGEEGAQNRLIEAVYNELHRVARGYMRRERPDHTLQATALVHEAYIRLVPQDVAWQSRSHFLAIAAKQMRRILLDHARKKRAARREGERRKLSLDDAVELARSEPQDLVLLDEALTALGQEHERRARIVELRFFGGYAEDEVSQILGVSVETVRRDWKFSKAWLAARLRRASVR